MGALGEGEVEKGSETRWECLITFGVSITPFHPEMCLISVEVALNLLFLLWALVKKWQAVAISYEYGGLL